MEITSMETLATRMVEITNQTNTTLEQAGRAMDHVERRPKWVTNQIKRLAGEIRTRADQFHQEMAGCEAVAAFCAEKFETGLRAVSGAVFMVATGIDRRNTDLITLAHMAQQEGNKVMLAAWVATQSEPDQSPATAVASDSPA